MLSDYTVETGGPPETSLVEKVKELESDLQHAEETQEERDKVYVAQHCRPEKRCDTLMVFCVSVSLVLE